MKRLFVVKQYHYGEVVAAVGHFDNKKAAKEQRDELNKQSGGDHFCVSPGPDHNGLVRSSHRNTRKRKLRGTRPVKVKGVK